jgi:hypothetical protein
MGRLPRDPVPPMRGGPIMGEVVTVTLDAAIDALGWPDTAEVI